MKRQKPRSPQVPEVPVAPQPPEPSGRRSWLVPLAVGAIIFLLTLLMTFPAAKRSLSLDDIPHLRTYPRENAGLSVVQLFTQPHWKVPDPGGLWRPTTKLLWRITGPVENEHTYLPWIVTAILSGLAAGLWCAAFHRAERSVVCVVPVLVPFCHGMTSDVTLPFVGQADLVVAVGLLGALVLWQKPGWPPLLGGGFCYFLALYSKESALPGLVAIPAVLWLLIPSGPMRKPLVLRTSLAALTCTGVRILSYIAVMGRMPFQTVGQGRADIRTPGMLELAGRYVGAFFVQLIPPADATFLFQEERGRLLYSLIGCGSTTIVVALAVYSVFLYRRPESGNLLLLENRVVAGLLWAVLFLAPFLISAGFVTPWAGRFLFLPMLGVALALSGSLEKLRGWQSWTLAAVIILFSVLGATKTLLHAPDWKSPYALWQAETVKYPTNALAWKNYGVCLQQSGRNEEALAAFSKATSLSPGFGEGWLARGLMESHLDRLDPAEKSLGAAAQMLGSDRARYELALVLARQRRYQDALKALEQCTQPMQRTSEYHSLQEKLMKAASAGVSSNNRK